MSIQSPRSSRPDRVVSVLLSLPIAAISSVFKVARRALTRASQAAGRTDSSQLSVPDITVNCQYEIADRAYAHYYGGTKVSFYLYTQKRVIRAVARKGSCTKEMDFTPDLADKANLPFNLDGAIDFIRQNGFKRAHIAGNRRQRSECLPVPTTPLPTAEDTQPVLESQPALSSKQEKVPKRQSAANPSKKRPFTGRVLAMGESIRPGRDGAAPYTTYAITLQSETGGIEREFIGEHLSELVETHQVKEGSLIRLQLLGRNRFEVVVKGKPEERWRNEYSLAVLRS